MKRLLLPILIASGVKAQDVLWSSAANTNAQSDDLSVARLSGTLTKDLTILLTTTN